MTCRRRFAPGPGKSPVFPGRMMSGLVSSLVSGFFARGDPRLPADACLFLRRRPARYEPRRARPYGRPRRCCVYGALPRAGWAGGASPCAAADRGGGRGYDSRACRRRTPHRPTAFLPPRRGAPEAQQSSPEMDQKNFIVAIVLSVADHRGLAAFLPADQAAGGPPQDDEPIRNGRRPAGQPIDGNRVRPGAHVRPRPAAAQIPEAARKRLAASPRVTFDTPEAGRLDRA